MIKNATGQGVYIYAQDGSGSPVVDDQANITATLYKDGGAGVALTETNPTQVGSGVYWFAFTQSETNCDAFCLQAESTTPGVILVPIFGMPKSESPTEEEIKTALEAEGSSLAQILEDTNELQGNQGNWLTADVSVLALETSVQNVSSQIDALGSGTGAALNFAAEADNTGSPIKSVTFVGTQTNTYTSTAASDGIRHQIADVGNSLDIVYQFNIGSGRNGALIVFKGYVQGVGDIVNVQAYNGSTWDTRFTISGQPGSTNIERDINLLASHTGIGTDAGKVFIRFTSTDDTVLHVDELLVAGVAVGLTTGYSEGAVWVKSTGTSGTTPFINGTADNPCPWDDALVVAGLVGLTRFRIVNGETITLSMETNSKSLIGKNWYLALGGQEISNSHFEGASVSGSGTVTGDFHPTFVDCDLHDGYFPHGKYLRCGIGGTGETFVGNNPGHYDFIDCYSNVPGSGTPVFNFSGAGDSVGINLRRWSGGSNITLDSDCAISVEVVTGGGQTIITGGGNVEIRGICRAVTLTTSGSSVSQIAAVTGPVTINGTGGTVNIYGVTSSVTDNSTDTTVNKLSVNAETAALETTLTTMKGESWTDESLKAIFDKIVPITLSGIGL